MYDGGEGLATRNYIRACSLLKMAADASDPNHPDSMVKKLFGRSKAEEKVMEAIKLRYRQTSRILTNS